MDDDQTMNPEMNERQRELRNRLTSAQYEVTQRGGTERPFTGEFFDCHDAGTYRCVVCAHALFDSDTKFDSGTGWPSFWQAIDDTSVERLSDRSAGMVRTEARCSNCGAHLGHIFTDGPNPTGERFCINSAALTLERATPPSTQME